ncbi:NAD(P)-dependent dehydrogenase, short-chain alcohol dehydrogenase family [Pedobacter suwonensis]|uniref:NAD(P)-dependent dehydrogenase, short-chain alcohol dehydrogenase family n=1 Tax=Pedobacter suwonensis TaxID=332999 RepID=A0A1I0SLA8_9SPHI|nr:SDR family oxidoreductase [Pedobacter suwonensis]SFA40217.1 NAD(P)-dependent dehydrogenase, short-chain alcohol dehydrogenase family [Pedobacter suwonensis]
MIKEIGGLFSLENKVVVVTGATGILGEAFVNGLCAAGATIVVIGRNEEVAKQRVAEVIDTGGKAIYIIADVLDEQQLVDANTTIIKTYGRIDALVNAAGGNIAEAVIQPGSDIFDINISALKQAFDLNLFGTILPTQIFGREIAKNGGSIVNISSVSANQAVTRVLGYSLAKTSIDCFTKWMAVELANRYQDKIRINSIVPGFFITNQNRALLTNNDGSLTARGQAIIAKTPFKRFGAPEELIGALVYLLSDAAKFVNGENIKVDGGFTAFSGV